MPRRFRLIDLMMLVAATSLGLAALPTVLRPRRGNSNQMMCASKMRQVALALIQYSQVHGTFPAGETVGPGRGVGQSAIPAILPYVDRQALYDAYNFECEPWSPAPRIRAFGMLCGNSACPLVGKGRTVRRKSSNVGTNRALDNRSIAETGIALFRCPASRIGADCLVKTSASLDDGTPVPVGRKFGATSYAVNVGGRPNDGTEFVSLLGPYRGVLLPVTVPGPRGPTHRVARSEIADGMATTLLLTERRRGGAWAVGGRYEGDFTVGEQPAPPGASDDSLEAGSNHDGGVNAAFCDGSVRFLSSRTARPVWYALITRDGGETMAAGSW